jgi:hypothetical protein
MHVPIFLPVDSMKKISFTLEWDVDALGVGIVEKSIALFTMIRKLENGAILQKTITMLCAAVKSLDLRKKTIARVDTVDIVQNVGKQCWTTIECPHSLKKQQKHLFLFRLLQEL